MKRWDNVRKQQHREERNNKLLQDFSENPSTFSFNATIFFFVVVVFVSLKNACMIVRQQISTRWTQHQKCIHTSCRGSEGGAAVLPEELPAPMRSHILCKKKKT